MTETIFTVTSRHLPDGPHVLQVAGELDHHTAPQLREAFAAIAFTPELRLLIDASGLTYCDSTGITAMVAAYQRARAVGTTLSLAGLNPDLTRVFGIVGLDQVFTMHATPDEAIDALRS